MSGTARHGKRQTLAATVFSSIHTHAHKATLSAGRQTILDKLHIDVTLGWFRRWICVAAVAASREPVHHTFGWEWVCCHTPLTGSCNTPAVLHSHEDWTNWWQGGKAVVPIGIGPICPQCAWEGPAKPTCLVNILKPVSHTNNCFRVSKIFLKPLSSGLLANCFLQLYVSEWESEWVSERVSERTNHNSNGASVTESWLTLFDKGHVRTFPKAETATKRTLVKGFKFDATKERKGFLFNTPCSQLACWLMSCWFKVPSFVKSNQHRRWSGCHHWQPV